MFEPNFQSESASGRRDHDDLGTYRLAESVAEIIRKSTPPFCIAISGPWGSGKTTVLRQIDDVLSSKNRICTLFFESWKFRSVANLTYALIFKLTQELPGGDNKDKLKKVFRVLAAASKDVVKHKIGIEISDKLLEESLSALQKETETVLQSIDSLADDANAVIEALCEHKHADRAVIFIDDLDRCSPLDAITMVEEMTIHFRFKQAVLVFGINYDLIESGLKIKYGLDWQHTQAFSDKLVNLRIELNHTSSFNLFIKSVFKDSLGIKEESELDDSANSLIGSLTKAFEMASCYNPRLIRKVAVQAILIFIVENRAEIDAHESIVDYLVLKAAFPKFDRLVGSNWRLLGNARQFLTDAAGRQAVLKERGQQMCAEIDESGITLQYLNYLIEGSKSSAFQDKEFAKLIAIAR